MAEGNIERRNALISVWDKTGIERFAEGLHRLNWTIYGSEGTAKRMNAIGIPAIDVAELVGGEPILGHKVVTLSREVHAGLLATGSPEDTRTLVERAIPWLDLVCVDMYPLRKAIADSKSEAEIIEMTDVGGPTMLHSAAKGRRVVLSKASQREPVLGWLEAGMPNDEAVRRTLAATAEHEAASYLLESAHYLGGLVLGQDAANSYDAALRGMMAAA